MISQNKKYVNHLITDINEYGMAVLAHFISAFFSEFYRWILKSY